MKRVFPYLFVLLLVLHLLPIWVYDYFPTSDGPAHLSTAASLLLLHSDDFPIFREYYESNWTLSSNQFVAASLFLLMIFFEPIYAEKILLSLYVILLPVAALYALTSLRSSALVFSFLIFPFLYSRLIHMGLYNYSLSLPFFFFVVGYYLKYYSSPRAIHVISLSSLLLATYFIHIFAAVNAIVAIGSIATARFFLHTFAAGTTGSRSPQWNSAAAWNHLGAVTLACAPTIIFVLMFVISLLAIEPGGAGIVFESFMIRISRLAAASVLVSFSLLDVIEGVALNVLFFVLVIVAGRRIVLLREVNRTDEILFAALTFAVIFLLIPERVGSEVGFLSERTVVYVYFMLILWLGTQSFQLGVRRAVGVMAIFLAIGGLAYRMPIYGIHNEEIREYTSASKYIEKNSTVLPIFAEQTVIPMTIDAIRDAVKAGPGTVYRLPRLNPLRHAIGYIAANHQIVDLKNYQARKKVFPIRFRPDRIVGYKRVICDPNAGPLSELDISGYNTKTGGRIDYVLFWGNLTNCPETEGGRKLLRDLETGYELIHTSEPNALMKVYRLKGDS